MQAFQHTADGSKMLHSMLLTLSLHSTHCLRDNGHLITEMNDMYEYEHKPFLLVMGQNFADLVIFRNCHKNHGTSYQTLPCEISQHNAPTRAPGSHDLGQNGRSCHSWTLLELLGSVLVRIYQAREFRTATAAITTHKKKALCKFSKTVLRSFVRSIKGKERAGGTLPPHHCLAQPSS
jgi:hypothetical protein